MARTNPVRTASAVVDIDQVWFAKHSAFTNGEEPVIDDTLLADASAKFKSIATLRSTVTVEQDDLSLTKILIDQTSAPIGISTEAGDFNISLDMPSLAAANLVDWFDDHGKVGTDEVKDSNSLKSVQGLGYNPTETLSSRVLILVTRTGQTFVFPNVQGACTLKKGENEVWLVHFAGQVLSSSRSTTPNKAFYILADPQVSSGEE